MSKRLTPSSGITFIEVILVVALIVILGATSAPFLSNFVTYNNFDLAHQHTVGSLRKAQAYAMDNKSGGTWGVCLTSGMIRLYRGSCASPAQMENYLLPGVVSISGLSDVSFNRRGEPSTATSISVSTALESKTIQLNSAGGFTFN